jgi:cysteine desulfurase
MTNAPMTNNQSPIYLDHSATTPVDPRVVEAMLPYFTAKFGNASSLHRWGQAALAALDESRRTIAEILRARPNEIVFTGCGSESDNLALRGVALALRSRGSHIIITPIEHHAILNTAAQLEKEFGFEVTRVPVNRQGVVNPDDIGRSVTPRTILISVMYANNEIGTIEPIEEIGKIAREHDVLFHTDAVQAVGKLPINTKKLPVDLLALSSHKLYGPKGVGALYIRNGVKLQPIIHGGGHEKGLRSSTLNVPGIVGLGKACELAGKSMDKDNAHIKQLRDLLVTNVLRIEQSYLNGHPTQRLVNNAHFRFTGIEGESLLLQLDEQGIATSTGSACSSKKLQASHVLTAIGLNPVDAHGSLRLSLGRENTKDEIAFVSKVIPEVVEKLRMMSPLWNR